jgi:hypothetical protein
MQRHFISLEEKQDDNLQKLCGSTVFMSTEAFNMIFIHPPDNYSGLIHMASQSLTPKGLYGQFCPEYILEGELHVVPR